MYYTHELQMRSRLYFTRIISPSMPDGILITKVDAVCAQLSLHLMFLLYFRRRRARLGSAKSHRYSAWLSARHRISVLSEHHLAVLLLDVSRSPLPPPLKQPPLFSLSLSLSLFTLFTSKLRSFVASSFTPANHFTLPLRHFNPLFFTVALPHGQSSA